MKNKILAMLALMAISETQGVKLRNKDDDTQLDEIDDSSISSLTEKAHVIVSENKANQLTQKLQTIVSEKKKDEDGGAKGIADVLFANKSEKNQQETVKKEENESEKIKEVSVKDFEIDTENKTALADKSEKDDSAEMTKKAEKATGTEESVPNSNLIQIKKLLTETSMEELVGEVISRKDGLNHLLLSDVNLLMESLAHDFPEFASMYSIGKSFEGRDINVIEFKTSGGGKTDSDAASTEPKVVVPKENSKVQTKEEEDLLVQLDSGNSSKPAVLMTGATHARELISTSMNVYEMLKLVKEGYIDKNDKYSKLLDQNRYLFVPILNVDGVNYIEEQWEKTHKIVADRKSMNPGNGACDKTKTPKEDLGVDINRNFGVDFGQVDEIVKYQMQNYDSLDDSGPNKKDPMKIEPCDYNYPGPAAFSEPETQAYKNFLEKNQKDLSFVMNVHSNGNAFIYPFNGRQKNDIEQRRPGIMNIFSEISNKAPFPQGTMKGTSKELMGIAIGGDQDDWTLDALGVPSITAEVGYVGQFIDEWRVKDASTANDIMREQSPWIEYVFQNLPQYHSVIQAHKK